VQRVLYSRHEWVPINFLQSASDDRPGCVSRDDGPKGERTRAGSQQGPQDEGVAEQVWGGKDATAGVRAASRRPDAASPGSLLPALSVLLVPLLSADLVPAFRPALFANSIGEVEYRIDMSGFAQRMPAPLYHRASSLDR
jgi:hypothetical protein